MLFIGIIHSDGNIPVSTCIITFVVMQTMFYILVPFVCKYRPRPISQCSR